MRGIGNERGVIVSWFAKLLVGLAVVAVVLFDTGSIVINYFTLDGAADDTATALSLAFETDQFGTNDEQLYEAAKELVATGTTNAADAKVVHAGTNVDENGVIHVKLKRVAKTLVVERIEAISKWAKATAEGQASTR